MTQAGRGVVAIVDDDDGVLDSLRFLLGVIGHTIETYRSAIEFLRADLGHLLCLIVDHDMPGMTGLELVGRLRTPGSDLPILPVPGSPSPAITARALELGVTRVLEKPPGENDVTDFIMTARPSP